MDCLRNDDDGIQLPSYYYYYSSSDKATATRTTSASLSSTSSSSGGGRAGGFGLAVVLVGIFFFSPLCRNNFENG